MMEVLCENEKQYSILSEQLTKQTAELSSLRNEAKKELERTVQNNIKSAQDVCDKIPFFRLKERQQKQRKLMH